MRVLILGGTGFIGPHIVRRLLAQGHQVTVFRRESGIGNLPEGVGVIVGDRNRLEASAGEFRNLRPDVVVDVIAFTEEQAKGLMSAFRGIAKRIVVLSSGDVYRANDLLFRRIPGTFDPVLFDAPAVVDGGKRRVKAAGLGERCEVIGGDFFDSVPTGGDAYILSFVIHDWDDERVTAILKNCRRAIRRDGRLLLVEVLLGPPNEAGWGKLADVYMLAVTGGRERTELEYRELLASAGFDLTRTISTQALVSIIEGLPL